MIKHGIALLAGFAASLAVIYGLYYLFVAGLPFEDDLSAGLALALTFAILAYWRWPDIALGRLVQARVERWLKVGRS